ncbi:similar to EMB514 [Actinidia rufa]|uniref:Similar to EMB514 n=1 Tax=Actinidia rufa TaxID=165716 RepID=A0A7J0H481_9ERIC|nr:similar to EMB514 [Actinidia rufa]
MAEAAATEAPETAQDMELETPNTATDESTGDAEANGGEYEENSKRAREEEAEEESGGEKKQKTEKSAEEERFEKLGGGEKESDRVGLGPKSFGSSVEMFDYFYKLLHYWPPNLNVNKYEHMMLLDLLKKGHLEPEKKIGEGAAAFQVRYHPQWKSRCFFIVRTDESVDDFSFRKCVDHILPLPENMQIKSDVNKALGGGGRGHGGRGGGGRGGGGHGRGRGGRGRGGKPRN